MMVDPGDVVGGLANAREHKGYPEMLAFMENHLHELNAYEDRLIGEIAERNQKLKAVKEVVEKLSAARDTLKAYLYFMANPDEAPKSND